MQKIKRLRCFTASVASIAVVVVAGDADAAYVADAASVADEADEAERAGVDDERHARPAAVATQSGWTPWVSEENPPVSCDPGSLVNQFGCSGSNCDNNRLFCAPTGAAAVGAYWTAYFSEEGDNSRLCADGSWMSGLACRGSYCDNISLLCTGYPALSPKDCFWTGWISEEGGGTLSFGPSYYARGAQCQGSYCDNKRFYVCRL
jgi:hypothetical protein